jgi:hypothetical protein
MKELEELKKVLEKKNAEIKNLQDELRENDIKISELQDMKRVSLNILNITSSHFNESIKIMHEIEEFDVNYLVDAICEYHKNNYGSFKETVIRGLNLKYILMDKILHDASKELEELIDGKEEFLLTDRIYTNYVSWDAWYSFCGSYDGELKNRLNKYIEGKKISKKLNFVMRKISCI